MNCSEARKVLYPTPDRCALTIEVARALEHLQECSDCRRYFETQAEWSRLLRARVGSEVAPEPLRQRIAGAVEKLQTGRTARKLWHRRLPIAAAVAVIALLAGWWAYRLPSQLLFQTACEDHVKYANADSQVRSSDTGEIESWFQDKTDFSVRVPALENTELLGGRLCLLRKHKAALIFYRKRGRPVSLFLLNGRGVNLRALDRWDVDGAPLWRMSWRGYSLAAFRDRGILHVLISDLRESELLQLAADVRLKARGY